MKDHDRNPLSLNSRSWKEGEKKKRHAAAGERKSPRVKAVALTRFSREGRPRLREYCERVPEPVGAAADVSRPASPPHSPISCRCCRLSVCLSVCLPVVVRGFENVARAVRRRRPWRASRFSILLESRGFCLLLPLFLPVLPITFSFVFRSPTRRRARSSSAALSL